MNLKSLYISILLLFCVYIALGQTRAISGIVLSADGTPLDGVTVQALQSGTMVTTNENGHFTLLLKMDTSIQLSAIGYYTVVIPLRDPISPLTVKLQQNVSLLDAVIITTGYQSISKESATGSFATLSNELINRSVSTDILSRMENVTSGLLSDKRFPDGTGPLLSIRGQSTVQSNDAPLIVVDNFPYEGSIMNINPNDVEDITVLKDAAAASIWGSRAGNGVIVITTKRGKLNTPLSIDINAITTAGERPDLSRYKGFLPSNDFIDVERYLFDKKYYLSTEDDIRYPVLSPVVELLIAERDQQITANDLESELKKYMSADIRNDLKNFFYRRPLNQQFSINLNGGGNKSTYFFGAGFNKDNSEKRRDNFSRVTINALATFHPVKNLEFSNNIAYNNSTDMINSGILRELFGSSAKIYPYAQLVDEEHKPLPVLKDYRASFISSAEEGGLLNWQFKPLEDLNNTDNKNVTEDVRINNLIKYTIVPGLNLELRYQYQHESISGRELQSLTLYSTRNLINQYAQYTGTDDYNFSIPKGEILDLRNRSTNTHAGRAQINYNGSLGAGHKLVTLAGVEIRQTKTIGDNNRIYGYNDDLLTYTTVDYVTQFLISPGGYTSRISDGISLVDLTDRNFSYFGNATYSYNGKYILSGSARKDESNLFGVKANQKGVPLWSGGIAWVISQEKFYKAQALLPYLKFRTTYGYSGNVNKSLTAFTTGGYGTSSITGLPHLQIYTPPNDQLRWEKVRMINIGLDFSIRDNILSGSLEYYRKEAFDLIGQSIIDPTIGFNLGGRNALVANNAALKGSGFDAQITFSKHFKKITWDLRIMHSFNHDRITEYKFDNEISSFFSGYPAPNVGKPRFSIYSLRFAGLDPDNGDPILSINGQPSKDYSGIYSNMTKDDLKYNGPALPTHFGSILNSVKWKEFSIGFNITYKLGYWFRRSSINYTGLFENWRGHSDYTLRWKKTGDEEWTNVPSLPEPGSTTYMRDFAYTYSDALVEKGDHIRLQDINLTYQLNNQKNKWLPFSSLTVYSYINNVGILWRENKAGIDPDYYAYLYPPLRTITLGVRINL